MKTNCITSIFIGDISISGIEFDERECCCGSDPQFTLTCISTGGPATTVTWTRNSTTVTEGTETVLDDPQTAQYTHTLTLTGELQGEYTCIVSNNKPSSHSSSISLTKGLINNGIGVYTCMYFSQLRQSLLT